MSIQRIRGTVACLTSMALCLVLQACGGGGGGGGNSQNMVPLPASAASINDANVALVEVRPGPTANVNIPYVSVTVCQSGAALGTGGCRTINNILLDTGSYGLRLFASQLNGVLPLPAQPSSGNGVLYECANFVNTSAWGGVQVADVVIGGERAPSVPIQLMDASNTGDTNCVGAPLLSTVNTPPNPTGNVLLDGTVALSANGILGVGIRSNDGQSYFNCTTAGTGCTAITATTPQQVKNPVGQFAIRNGNTVADNNGVVVQLPALPSSGQAYGAYGYLIFGINTQPNNQLAGANVVPLNNAGYFSTVYRGQTMGTSMIDSGSNGLYFADPSPAVLPTTCTTSAQFYCPRTPVSLSATIQLATSTVTVPFTIASADGLGSNYAISNLGGTMSNGSFDWGLPFFYGRSVYTVMEGTFPNQQTGLLRLPFYAFTN